MAYRKRFCVVCGSEETQTQKLSRGLCPKCLASEKSEIEVRAEHPIRVCKICGNLEERGRWVTRSAKELKESISDMVVADPERFIGKNEGEVLDISVLKMPSSIGSNSVLVPLCVRTRQNNLQCPQTVKTFNARIRLIPTICPNCLLIKQKYYEATLQIRAASGEISKEEKEQLLRTVDVLMERLGGKNKQTYISKVEERPAGFDLFFGSRQTAYAIASKFKAEKGVTSKETFKAGKIDKSRGKRKDKVTILIKLPRPLIDEMARMR